MPPTPARLVEHLVERIAPLEIEFARAYWDSQVDATPANDARRARLELAVRTAKGDPAALAEVEAALDDAGAAPLVRRQLEVLRLSLTGNQMDADVRARIVALSSRIESEFASYRPRLDGRVLADNDIEQILRTSDDADLRRRAWEASKEIGAVVADDIRALARLRNEAARALGFTDYYRMALSLQEIDERWLFSLLADLERLTAAPFAEYRSEIGDSLARRFGTAALRPWHLSDPFFQQLPVDGRISLDGLLGDADAVGLARATFAHLGIDLTPVLEASDLHPRERKSQHALCIDIDRSTRDVRILANVVPGERWCEIMLHESGHAGYDVCLDPDLPYPLRRAAHTFVTEAVAIMFGRLVRDPAWLAGVVGAPAAAVAAAAPGLERSRALHALVFARWALVMIHFERDLYSDPEGGLDARWWELVERFQMVAAPPGRSAPDWAAKVHIAAAPVYYHNYLLGELLASQLRAAIESRCGALVGSAAAGDYLRTRLFAGGSSLPWPETVAAATGEPLSASRFAAEAVPA